jgi:hypothetical protein
MTDHTLARLTPAEARAARAATEGLLFDPPRGYLDWVSRLLDRLLVVEEGGR